MRRYGLLAALGIMMCFSITAFSATENVVPVDATQMLTGYARELPAPRLEISESDAVAPFGLSLSRELPAKKPGDIDEFWTCNIASNTFERTQASLSVVGKHCYVYLEKGQSASAARLEEIADEFDTHIYPTVTGHFGQEWNPGVDNDPRITLLLMDIKDGYQPKGMYTAGYFNPGDEYPEGQLPAGSKLKGNQREMLYIDINPSDITSRTFLSVVAHEFQHMIHFHQDSKENTWVNEGCSQMATWLCGYGHPTQVKAFTRTPDNSLVAWNRFNMLANYGQTYLWNSFLTTRYLQSEQQRKTFFTALVKDQEKGVKSYDTLLKGLGTDFTTAHREFVLTCFLNDPTLEKGRYSLGKGLEEVKPAPSDLVKALPGMLWGDVFLWAADAVKVDLAVAKKTLRIDFAGDLTYANNQFDVLTVFMDNSGTKRIQIHIMDNIKATSDRAPIQPVMLPGGPYSPDDPYTPPPPQVRTQMGYSVVDVPEGFDTMFVFVIGKTPIGDPEEFFGLDPKVRYRLDIKDSGESPRPAQMIAMADLASLVREYAILADTDGSAPSAERIERIDQLSREIAGSVRVRLETGTASDLEGEIRTLRGERPETPAMTALFAKMLSQTTFQRLHTTISQ
ncbi:MAG: Neutral metalloprotease precursor [bacterium ADurb.Bin374]|nr:MAG: Neutral metalloprotease precursor [bacterium ADurb.Bin374]